MAKQDPAKRFDAERLNGDLQATYVELLSAQCAVDRLKHRYTPEMVALNGGSFMLLRSISAAMSMSEYFRKIEELMPAEKAASRI